MAEKKLRIGNRVYVYESNDVDPVDGQQIESVRSEGQARFAQSPTHVEHVVRLQDLIDRGIAQAIVVVQDISDVSSTLEQYDGTDYRAILCIEKGLNDNPDKLCLFRYQDEFDLGEHIPFSYTGKIVSDTHGYWLACGPTYQVGGTSFWGHLLPFDESTCNVGFPAVGELPAVEWDGGYFVELQASKTPTEDNDVLRKTEYDALDALITAAGVAGIPVVAVADISTPTEMASVVGSAASPLRIARQVATPDVATLYLWDASAGSADSPRVVASTGGSWVAIAGRYMAGALGVGGALAVAGAITAASLATTGGVSVGTTLGVTGAVTLSSTLGVTGTSTLGVVNTSGVQTHTGQPRSSAVWTGSQTLTNATDYTMTGDASPAFTWTEEADIGGAFAGGVYTVPNAGCYLFNLTAQGSNSTPAAAQDNSLYLEKQTGGSGAWNVVSQQVLGAGNTHFGNVLSDQLELAAGDKLRMRVRQDTGANSTLTAAQFRAVKVA